MKICKKCKTYKSVFKNERNLRCGNCGSKELIETKGDEYNRAPTPSHELRGEALEIFKINTRATQLLRRLDSGQGGWFGESRKHSLAAKQGKDKSRMAYLKKKVK